MSVFPQLGTIDSKITDTINSRIGNNIEVSKLMPWFRVSSAGNEYVPKKQNVDYSTGKVGPLTKEVKASEGLILESTPVKNSFESSYGGYIDKERKSGRVGTNFKGGNVYADGTDRTYRPSPTIDSLSIENGSRGLSKKAKFQITCYTLAQAETVSGYFLEPGFVVLCEFGFNRLESIKQKANLAEEQACGIAKYNNYEYVLNKRKI